MQRIVCSISNISAQLMQREKTVANRQTYLFLFYLVCCLYNMQIATLVLDMAYSFASSI